MSKKMNWTKARTSTTRTDPRSERLDRAADRLLNAGQKKPKEKGWKGSRGAAGPCISVVTGRVVHPGPRAPEPVQKIADQVDIDPPW